MIYYIFKHFGIRSFYIHTSESLIHLLGAPSIIIGYPKKDRGLDWVELSARLPKFRDENAMLSSLCPNHPPRPLFATTYSPLRPPKPPQSPFPSPKSHPLVSTGKYFFLVCGGRVTRFCLSAILEFAGASK